MTALEVILIIVGIIFLLVSFLVEEKLSKKDIDMITDLSEEQLKFIVDRQLKNAESRVEDSIDQMLEESHEVTKRAMEKETNEKIMAISEYSNTVLESMNKTHNEILFLYSMLNDKHTELTDLAAQLQEFSKQMKNTEDEVLNNLAEAARELEGDVRQPQPIDEREVVLAAVDKEESGNHNEYILGLHQNGVPDVEIAKQLGLGLGEVKLVIGLYKGAADEI